MTTWEFAKGHATKNDFVLIKDRHALTPVTSSQVRWLCDRRAGVGGDGLIRVVKAGHIPEWAGDPDLWFMDYRNADGSVAEICGNGLRVLVRYLLEEDLASGQQIDIATRAGLRSTWPQSGGLVRTSLGRVTVLDEPTWVEMNGVRFNAIQVDVGNPHLVVFLDADTDLASLDLTTPYFDQTRLPQGSNVEFVKVQSDHHLAFRVFERGDGETPSCGTGTVAVAAAQSARLGCQPAPDGERFAINVRGGHLEVDLRPDQAYLIGSACVVARGVVTLPD